MDGSVRAVRWLVSGRVQGVGFRYHVIREARRLGVRGDVRNLADGRVEVRAGSEAGPLEELKQAVARGPRFARVDGIEEKELEGPAGLDEFEVRS
ncbi:MAG: acylphosphatase [bacterium]|nr:acylphosphatase [bacterium]